ncbi:MAG: hypothetical protein JWP29_3266 [Rhodoferax sp.]|nr:hypothetical protein [Rhodoferax sp.]
MKKKLGRVLTSAGILTLGLGLIAPVAFAAGPSVPDLYIGGNISVNRTADLGGKIDSGLASQGIASNSGADKSSTDPSLRLGYKFTPNFALEASYDHIASHDVNSTITSPNGDTASGHWKANGLGVHAVGIFPIDQKLSVYGRVGVEQFHTKFDLASNVGGSTAVSASDDNTSLVLGAGASYAINKNVDTVIEYNRFNHVGDAGTGRSAVNQFNVGLRYHFM